MVSMGYLYLLKSYLQNCSPYVSIGQYSFNAKSVHKGCSSEEYSWSLTFNMYINDIVNISTEKFVIYAYDSSFFFVSNNDDPVTIVNATLSKLGSYYFSDKKTSVLL